VGFWLVVFGCGVGGWLGGWGGLVAVRGYARVCKGTRDICEGQGVRIWRVRVGKLSW
jgi:hypothetical protein